LAGKNACGLRRPGGDRVTAVPAGGHMPDAPFDFFALAIAIVAPIIARK
jgi:hypothetical protein